MYHSEMLLFIYARMLKYYHSVSTVETGKKPGFLSWTSNLRLLT